MSYVFRDEAGAIVALSEKPIDDQWQEVSQEDPELKAFLNKKMEDDKNVMRSSDISFIRVLEDLIELMISKNMISFMDFPAAAQEKLLARRSTREKMRGEQRVSLVSLDDGLY
ncbi:MAG: tryptophan synthase subunit beta like protein [Endozoicomonadaceae bacterium]|nr:tryptophan synthase subunit beta like protein [Endozoicomonadaceae bacterium]